MTTGGDGDPAPSASSPTASARRARAAAELMRGPPLEPGVYVSEPHFLPPRMDASSDEEEEARERRERARLPPPADPPPSAPRDPPRTTAGGGFVPSPAERRAAALARERAAGADSAAADARRVSAVDDAAPFESEPSADPARRSVGAEHDEELDADPGGSDSNASDDEMVVLGDDVLRAPIHPRDPEEEDEDRLPPPPPEAEAGDASLRASIASLGRSLDAGILQSEREAELMAALVAEARRDAGLDSDCDEAGAASNANANDDDDDDDDDRALGSPAGPSPPSIAEAAQRELLDTLATLPLEDEDLPLSAHQPSDDNPPRSSTEPSFRAHAEREEREGGASLGARLSSSRGLLSGAFADGSLRGSAESGGGSRLRASASSSYRASFSSSAAAPSAGEDDLPSPPTTSGGFEGMKSKRRPAKSRDAFGRPLKKEKEKEKEPRRSNHPPGPLGPFETDAPPVRAALHARRRAMEEERSNAARAFAERRREAGRDALARFFAGREEEEAEKARRREDGARRSRVTPGARAPLRLKNDTPKEAAGVTSDAAKEPNRTEATAAPAEAKETTAVPASPPSPPSPPSVPASPPSPALRIDDPPEGPRSGPSGFPVDARAETRSKPSGFKPVSALAETPPPPRAPRVATRDAETRRVETAAAAAATAAAEAVARATRVAAAAASHAALVADGAAPLPPPRGPRAPPLPKVASFEPDQKSHVTAAEAAARKRAEAAAHEDALATLKRRAAEKRRAALEAAADLEAAKRALEAGDATGGAGAGVPAAFDAAFEAFPGEVTGASGLTLVDDGEGGLGRGRGGSEGVQRSSSDPAADLPSGPTKSPGGGVDPRAASPSPPLRKKAEAMWIDVGAWNDASREGIPSGAWGAEQMERNRATTGGGAVVEGGGGGGRALGGGLPVGSSPPRDEKSLARRAPPPRLGEKPRRPFSSNKSAAVSVVPAYRAAAKPSNRKLIRNALSHVCLAGAANAETRELALEALDAIAPEEATVFVVLFRENTSPLKFRALYALVDAARGDADEDAGEGGGEEKRLVKIHGAGGPQRVRLDMVESTMKYDSGTREFKPLATKGIMPQTAAFTLAKR